MLTPQQFGAVGNGLSNPLSSLYGSLTEAQSVYPFAVSLTDELDWCGIQKAINVGRYDWNNAPGWDLGMKVSVPPGQYRVNRTIQVRGVRGQVIEGDGLPILRWYGDNASPIFRYTNADSCEMRRLWFMHGNYGINSILSAIDLERGNAGTWTPTANKFEGVRIGGFNLGMFKFGVRILLGEGGDGNNDYHKFVDCQIDGVSEAGLFMNATQAHQVTLERCGFGGARFAKCAVRIANTTTRLCLRDCGGGGHTEMDFDLKHGNHQTWIERWNSEHSNMLVQCGTGPNSNPFDVRFPGLRFETDYLNPDGVMVRGWGPGPLTFDGGDVASWNGVQPKFEWWSNWSDAQPAQANINNLVFLGTTDFFNLIPTLERCGCMVDKTGSTRWSPGLNKFISI